MDKSNIILWPSGYGPEKSPIHVHNEIDMNAPAETVWAWLIRAQLWPTGYPNSANIRFLKGKPPDLALGTQFRWKTFGVTIESTVLEFVSFERLSWNGQGIGLDVYHAWLIQKTESGCRVVTEEAQRGWLNRLAKALRPKQMEQQHQIWLERLSEKAKSGLPPSP